MVDANVGVRELKQAAPELVRRAERGERIVVTRHGKPVAVLGPLPLQPSPVPTGKTNDWARERVAFERMLPKLERDYRARYVAICGGRVVGSDTDHERLFETMWKRLRGRVFFIGRVGKAPPVIDMPGFELDSK